MKCCKECPEYDICEDKKGCCDMCDFYNPKTKKCAYIKKKKKSDNEILSRMKIDEDLEALNVDGIVDTDEEYKDVDPYEEEVDDFFNT